MDDPAQWPTLRRYWLHRATFIAAGVYNIAWGCYAVADPQWFFRLSGLPLSNSPQIFATLGMVLGLYGILYLEVARVPERGRLIAAVGMTGKILGPAGLAWLIVTGVWPARTVILVITNDLIWWIPFALYLADSCFSVTTSGTLCAGSSPSEARNGLGARLASACGKGARAVSTPGGPTVRRILLGAQLRRLREAKGLTREAAGFEIRASESKISRLELGRVGFKERDITDLLQLYGITDETQREALASLAREANSPGWWHSYDDVLPNWFQTYVGLEEAASLIRSYEIQFLPGLLQTETYARAVVSAGSPDANSTEVERRVHLRVTRQQILRRASPPSFVAVVDEAALHRPIGGSKVMKEQLEHLLELMMLPNVTLQVMPFGFGGHAGEGGAFTMLRFPEPELPDVVYVEQLVSAYYLDKPEYVERYARTMHRLIHDSPPPDATRATLTRILAQTA